MHLPDGLLGNGTSASLVGAAAVFVGYGISKLKSELLKKKLVAQRKMALAEGDLESGFEEKWSLTDKGKKKLIGMIGIGSFIFAAQMIDVMEISGIPVHLIGTALAVIVLGPFAGILVMSLILGLQAFLLADGGIFALGANIMNMAITASLVTFLVYDKWFKKPPVRSFKFYMSAILAGWLSVLGAAVMYSLEIILSGKAGIEELLLMGGVHGVVGIAEGIVTALLIALFFPRLLRS